MTDVDEWVNGESKTDTIHEFHMDMIKFSEIVHCVGSMGSGKTFLELFISYIKKHLYPAAQIVCGTEDSQNAFTPPFGAAFVSSKYEEFSHKRACARQIICKKNNCPYNGIISIIDDIGYDRKASKCETIIKAHKNGSQWFDELMIMGYQSVKDVPEALLNAPSKVFIFLEKDDGNRRLIHRAYFKTLVPDYKEFSKMMNDICQDFACLVVDLKQQVSELSKCVFWFRAPFWLWPNSDDPQKKRPYPEGWRFGCKQYQEWSDARSDPNAVPEFITNLTEF